MANVWPKTAEVDVSYQFCSDSLLGPYRGIYEDNIVIAGCFSADHGFWLVHGIGFFSSRASTEPRHEPGGRYPLAVATCQRA